jgi:ATP-binding cassette subfamily B protein
MRMITDKIRKVSVLQHDASDCGAACLVSVIRYFGGHSSIENIRKLSGTSRSGTTMLGLCQAAQQCGMDATGYESSVRDLIDYKGVLILHVRLDSGAEHYVVCFGYLSGVIIIWDPARGLVHLSEEGLNKMWESKKCLGIVPNGSFVYEQQYKIRGRIWLKEIIRPDASLLITSIVLGIVVSALGLVMAVFSQKLLDRILPSKDLNLLLISIFLVFVLLIARILNGAVRQQILLYQGKSFNIRVIDNFFGSLMFLPRSFFDTRKTGDFVGRLNDTIRIQRVITEFVSVYIIDLLVLFISIGALFVYSAESGLITLLAIPVLFLVVYRWNKKVISGQHEVMSGYARSESNYIDSIQGISVIKSLGWQSSYKTRNKEIYMDFQEKVFSLGTIRIKLGLLTGIVGTFYLIIVLLFISVQVINDRMSEGELLAVLSICSTLVPSILNLALIALPVSEAGVAIERMFEFSRMEPEAYDQTDNDAPELHADRLGLEGISFRFPGRRLLLNDIGLTIEKGKIISLVGESGCGKSTLANIILRFYQPEAGRIVMNGGTLTEEVSLKKWRSLVGIVPQEIHIFNGTILQNLITDLTEDKLKEIIPIISGYGLDKFIEGFPSGIMTVIGEEGINLSGGQRQLIAFLRVLIRRPQILIIDEGTSNMDRGTERMIMDLMRKLKNEMGILMISHRINMIKQLSDMICVMEGGRMSAQGTHNELMKTDNLYKRFWDDYS